MASTINHNFVKYYSMHLRKRTASAFLWTFLVLPIGLFAISMISDIQPLSPCIWMKKCFWLLVSLKFWVFCLMTVLSAIPLTVQNATKFSVFPYLASRRIDHILFFFHPTNTILNFCYFFFSIVVSSAVLSLIHEMTVFDEEFSKNMKSWDFLLIASTSLIMACYLPFYFDQKRLYQFQYPLIQLPIFTRMKTNLKIFLFSSLKASFWLSLLIHLFNYFIAYPQARSNSVLELLVDIEMKQGSVSFTNLQMFYQQFIIVFSIHFFSGLHLCFYNILHTQPMEFPIMEKYPCEGNRCLPNALSCVDHPLLQHLAFLDLVRLSQCNRKRRSDLYSLSTPGHHPVYWKAVADECITQLDKYVFSLTTHIYAVLDGTYAPTTVDDAMIARQQDLKSARSRTTSLNNSTAISPLKPPSFPPAPCSASFLNNATVATPRAGNSRLRCTSLALPVQQSPSFFLSSGQPPKNYGAYTKGERPPTIFNKLLRGIKHSRPISYFFSELVERKNRKMFADAQKYIWLVQGISSLALHSYEEDHYGVVQSYLPMFLSSFLAFYDILCKPLPLSASGKKSSTHESRLKALLKSEVKSAIYKIVITFRNGLSSMTVSPEHLIKLNLFKELRE